jgi:hypothetical protein
VCSVANEILAEYTERKERLIQMGEKYSYYCEDYGNNVWTYTMMKIRVPPSSMQNNPRRQYLHTAVISSNFK